jgi:hypothetical protein
MSGMFILSRGGRDEKSILNLTKEVKPQEEWKDVNLESLNHVQLPLSIHVLSCPGPGMFPLIQCVLPRNVKRLRPSLVTWLSNPSSRKCVSTRRKFKLLGPTKSTFKLTKNYAANVRPLAHQW